MYLNKDINIYNQKVFKIYEEILNALQRYNKYKYL